jgi:hypothetical protein
MRRAETRKYHYIYKTTCLKTNKFYIGMHSTDDQADGYIGSGKHLWHSIKKHGKDNHVFEILEYLPTRAALKIRENEIVNVELIQNTKCMNIQLGGGGGWDHLTNEEFLSNCRKGATNYKHKFDNDPEFRKSINRKLSESNKRRHEQGTLTPLTFKYDWNGQKHSCEAIEKMKAAAIGRGLGEENSQYGTCWIFSSNERSSRKINKSDLNLWITNGWEKGRKIFKESASL